MLIAGFPELRRPGLRTRLAVVVTVLGIAMTAGVGGSLATAGPALAGSVYVTYNGQSINMAPVPAEPVTLTAVSTSPMTSVTFTVQHGATTTASEIVSAGGTHHASAVVDLTGRSGLLSIRTRVTYGQISSSIDKTLRAVPPVTASVAAVEPATSAPSSVSAPETTPTEAAPSTVSAPTAEATATAAPTSPSTPTATWPTPTSSPVGPAAAPGPANTGVPGAVVLTPVTGNITVTKPGTVIDAIDLHGCVAVRAHNVMIRNSRITCSAPVGAMVVDTNGTWSNLVVTDSELDGQGLVDIGIGWQNYTLTRVEIRGVNDGARAGSNSRIESSWIHSMTRRNGLHPDAVQSTGGTNIVVQGNTLNPRNYASGDQGNAAVMLGSETRPFVLQNVLIDSNVLSGGNFAINVRGDTAATNVVVTRNTFNADSKYGPILAPTSVTISEDNVMAATGLPAPIKRP